jgi:hypothetical protein
LFSLLKPMELPVNLGVELNAPHAWWRNFRLTRKWIILHVRERSHLGICKTYGLMNGDS